MDKTVSQIYQDAANIIEKATGVTEIVIGNDNGPQPNGEYASIMLIRTDNPGIDATKYNSIEGDETKVEEFVTGNLIYDFSVQFYRGDAPMDRARELFRYKQTSAGQEYLSTLYVTMHNVTSPRNTDYSIGAKWIERATMELELGASAELTNEVNTIGTITITINNEKTIIITEED